MINDCYNLIQKYSFTRDLIEFHLANHAHYCTPDCTQIITSYHQ
jgi:hypothetical protein